MGHIRTRKRVPTRAVIIIPKDGASNGAGVSPIGRELRKIAERIAASGIKPLKRKEVDREVSAPEPVRSGSASRPKKSYKLNAGRPMSREFVERRDESFYLVGSRVPLAHIVREFQRGESPEAIRSHYPSLSLEQVYGAITFYLGSQKDVETDIAEREREEDAYTTARPTPPEVRMTFERMQQSALRRS